MFWNLDDAVIGIYSPMDYKYMKLLRFILRILSSWPGKELGEETLMIEGMGLAYFHITVSTSCLVLGVCYLKFSSGHFTFFELCDLCLLLLMNLLTMSRGYALCLTKKYRNVSAYFIQKIHLFYHKEKSDFAMKMHMKVHLVSHIMSVYLLTATFIAVMVCITMPIYNNYAAGYFDTPGPLVNASFQHTIYLMYPFDFEKTINGYIAGATIGAYGTILGGYTICVFDLFLCLMSFNLWGHFKILIHHLDSFPLPATIMEDESDRPNHATIPGSEMYSKSELEGIAVELKECIEYHKLISDFTDGMSEAFGLAMACNYMFHQIADCLLLLQCSDLSPASLTRYAPVSAIIIGELILISVVFETIGSVSERLRDAVYNVPWEYMDKKNRKTVLIFMIRVQEPKHVKAGGMIKVGVTTMAAILKTSFSYYIFIRKFS